MTPAQHKKKGPNREHWCGVSRIPSEGQVRTSHNSRVLERGSRAWTSPSGIRSPFLLGISLRRILWDPFLMGIPLDFAKRGEQVISLCMQYLGGKQSLVSTVDF